MTQPEPRCSLRAGRRGVAALFAVLVVIATLVLPEAVLARAAPPTLAQVRTFGDLSAAPAAIDPPFAVEFFGVSWVSGPEPEIRFRGGEGPADWQTAHLDDVPVSRGRTFSALLPAGKADVVEVRGSARAVRVVAINTHDGPRRTIPALRRAEAAHLARPAVVSRSAWGADESLRYAASGAEIWPPAFYPTQMLVAHHTATANDASDYAGVMRAMYRYHAVDKGWGDIGYNFVVDPNGTIYKGRYSGPPGTLDQDTPAGENPEGLGVTAAHVSGANSGTMGIAVLGTYTAATISPAGRSALVEHLAWEADHHGLDPQAAATYTNPVNGTTRTANVISGHRDWVATECPGELLYDDLPQIRADVASRTSAGSPGDTTAPTVPTSVTAKGGKRKITLRWAASSDGGGSGLAGYEVWRSSNGAAGSFSRRASPPDTSYTDSGLPRGATFWYYVVAVDGAGNRSAPSQIVSARAT